MLRLYGIWYMPIVSVHDTCFCDEATSQYMTLNILGPSHMNTYILSPFEVALTFLVYLFCYVSKYDVCLNA